VAIICQTVHLELRLKRLAAVAFLLAACVAPIPEDATGEEIYAAVCARCHSRDLSGGIGSALGPDSNAAGQPDEFSRLTIKQGKGRMPSFDRKLTDAQIELVIKYLRKRQAE